MCVNVGADVRCDVRTVGGLTWDSGYESERSQHPERPESLDVEALEGEEGQHRADYAETK